MSSIRDAEILLAAHDWLLDASTFKESEHPRVKSGPESGQFTSKGGGGGAAPQQPASPSPSPAKKGPRNKIAQELYGKNYKELPWSERIKIRRMVKQQGIGNRPLGARYGLAGMVGAGFRVKMSQEMFGKPYKELSKPEQKQVKQALRNKGIVRPQNIAEAGDDESQLRAASIISTKSLGEMGAQGGVNTTVFVELQGGLKGVFKVASAGWAGEAKTEVGAWDVVKIVGLQDIAAPTVFKEHKGQKGTLMKMWDGQIARKLDKDKKFDGAMDLHRAAAFDYVIGNGDRHDGNWMVSNEGRLQLIDNGFSFKTYEFKPSAGFFPEVVKREALGDKPPITPQEAAKPYIQNYDAIAVQLQKTGLDKAQIEGVGRRIRALAMAKNWYSMGRAA